MDNDIFKLNGLILSPEYQAFSTSSELAPPVPSPTRECAPPPFESKKPIRTTGGKAWHSVHSVRLKI